MFYNGYAWMKRAYALAIFLSDQAEKFERYCYNWLDTFERGEIWHDDGQRARARTA